MGGMALCLSVCLKHHSYQHLSKLQAPGTSVNQIFRSSAGIQSKRKHIYGPPAVKHHGGQTEICTNQFLVTDGLSTQQAKSSNSFCVVDCISHMHHFQPLFLQKIS